MTYGRQSIWIMLFSLDFDHWLHPNDTLNMATGSNPDVASVCMIDATCNDHIEAWGNECYWRVVGMQEVGINYYKLLKTCHRTQVDSFVTPWGCAQSKEAIQDHWLVDYSSLPSGFMPSWQKCKRCNSGPGSSLSGEHAAKQEYGYFCTASITGSGPPYKPKIVIRRIKNYCYIVSHVNYPRINPYVSPPLTECPQTTHDLSVGKVHAVYSLLRHWIARSKWPLNHPSM